MTPAQATSRRRGLGFGLSLFLLSISLWHSQPRFLETRLQSEQYSELVLLFSVLCAVVAIALRGMLKRDRVMLGVSAFLTILLMVPDLEEYFSGPRRFSGAPTDTKDTLSVEYIDSRGNQLPPPVADIRVLRTSLESKPELNSERGLSTTWQDEALTLVSGKFALHNAEPIHTGKGNALRASVQVSKSRTLTIVAFSSLPEWWSWDNRVHVRRVMGQVRHLTGDVLVVADLGASPYTDLYAELLWTGRLDSGALGHGPYWTEGQGLLGIPVAAMSMLVRGNYAVRSLATFASGNQDRNGLRATLGF